MYTHTHTQAHKPISLTLSLTHTRFFGRLPSFLFVLLLTEGFEGCDRQLRASRWKANALEKSKTYGHSLKRSSLISATRDVQQRIEKKMIKVIKSLSSRLKQKNRKMNFYT